MANVELHAIEDCGHLIWVGPGAGQAGEDEKCGLERILRVCLVAQHAVADLQHHRAVAEQERVKGGLVSLASEAPQQLVVGQLAHALVEGDAADQLQDRAGRALGHRAVPGKRKRALHRYSSFRRLEEAVFSST